MKSKRLSRPVPQSAKAAAPSLFSHRGFVVSLVLLVASFGLAAGVWADWYYGLPADAQATYVGRQTCAECHSTQHGQWTGSHHDLAMDRATEEFVLGDFNDATLTHHGVTSRMYRRDGKFFIETEGPDGRQGEFEIKYVFGVDPLQQYMVEFDRPADMPENETARLQVLRVSWDTHNKKWFHLDPPDVHEKLDPADDLHWTGIAQRWNNMCADCHSTNLQKRYDVASGTYHTTWSEIDVSCEACHGPGSLHVQLAGAPSLFWDRQRGYALAPLKGRTATDTQGEIQACAPCHSRRRIVHEGYTAGCNYYDYFANELLPAGSYHADGQILDEVYEYGSFLQSKMYHKGIRCTDCHDPHTARLKHTGNQVCTSCHQHPAGKYDGAIHHRHADGSKGSLCVNCHMPETTYMAVDPRRDHSFRIPRPDLSVKLGTPNACTGCHLSDERLPGLTSSASGGRELPGNAAPERDYAAWLRAAASGDPDAKQRLAHVDRWADEQLEKWYGKNRKREPHWAQPLAAARNQSADARKQLLELLENKNMPAISRATAAMELGAYLQPGGDVADKLAKATQDREPQVRAAAVMSFERLSDPQSLTHVLAPALADSTRAVRSEAGRILARVPQLQFRGEEKLQMRRALDEAIAAAAVNNDRAGGHLLTGLLHESLGQMDAAEADYRTALRVEPGAVGPRANLAALLDQKIQAIVGEARQLIQSGQQAQAQELLSAAGPLEAEADGLRLDELALLERDARLVPDNAGLQSRIGFLRYLQGWRKEAEHAFVAAHQLEPRSPDFLYSLVIFYRDTRRPREAQRLAARLVELRPDDPMVLQLQREIQELLPVGPTRDAE
jgi:tetratricopeptide (TPR) repeat protein